jgi:hypothetical protein
MAVAILPKTSLIWGVLINLFALVLISNAGRIQNQENSDAVSAPVPAPNVAEHVKSLLIRLNEPSVSESISPQALEGINSECLAHLNAWGQNIMSEMWSIQSK